jgi:hypothetical protein
MGLHPALVSPGWHCHDKTRPFPMFICSTRGKLVNVETSKTDEGGQAVHEQCLSASVATLKLKNGTN